MPFHMQQSGQAWGTDASSQSMAPLECSAHMQSCCESRNALNRGVHKSTFTTASLMQTTSIERGTITQKDLDEALGESHATPEVLCVSSLYLTCDQHP